ncbi:putative Amino acid permease/ SLC12A domain-containing protein [Seiridium cardinale]
MADEKSQKVVAAPPSSSSVFEGGSQPEEQHGTKQNISSRQAQMIAIGGVIGTGLFVGTGQTLAVAGPVFLFVAYLIICAVAFCVATAVTEFNAYLPVPGASIPYYATRFVSPSLGFALGWLYWWTWGIAVAYEVTAASVVINYWPNQVPEAVWITIMLVVIIALNCMPVKWYAEGEFWFASIKVFTIIGLLVLSVVLFFGGGPNHTRLGFWYWQQDPVHEYLVEDAAGRVCAFIMALTLGSFSFLFGPEYIVSASGEMAHPRRDLPRAMFHFSWRLIFFYALSALAISVICPANEPGLTGGGNGAAASPWVLAIKSAGIKGLDSLINAVIITSAWSAGNGIFFMSCRALYSLALVGNAPRIFARCNRYGVPYYAVMLTACLSLLAYMNVSNSSSQVFIWLVSLLNEGGFISWICCCVCFFRFRKACTVQGVNNLPYKSRFQPYGAWFALILTTLMGLLNGLPVFFPGNFDATTFCTDYLGIPVFLVLYFGHRIYARHDPWARPAETVNLISGLAELEAREAMEPVDTVPEKKSMGKTCLDKLSAIWGWK